MSTLIEPALSLELAPAQVRHTGAQALIRISSSIRLVATVEEPYGSATHRLDLIHYALTTPTLVTRRADKAGRPKIGPSPHRASEQDFTQTLTTLDSEVARLLTRYTDILHAELAWLEMRSLFIAQLQRFDSVLSFDGDPRVSEEELQQYVRLVEQDSTVNVMGVRDWAAVRTHLLAAQEAQ